MLPGKSPDVVQSAIHGDDLPGRVAGRVPADPVLYILQGQLRQRVHRY